MIEYVLNIGLGYLFGSIPFGLVVGYLWLRRDIRDSGSGKTGTTNVLRTAGRAAAAVVMIGDISKGAAPALIGRFIFDDPWVAAAGAGAGIVGHVWPVFAGFRGGRGVATAFGGILGLSPLLALIFPVIGLTLIATTRYVSFMSVVGTPLSALCIIIAALAGWEPAAYGFYAAFAVAIVEFTHIPNIRRLLAGTEPKIGQGGNRAATG